MKNNTKLLFLLPIALLIIPVFAQETQEECIFTSHLEKSWIFFQERPWVTGSMINCDDGIQYHLKDTVYIRILDINGDLIGGGNADVSQVEVIHIRENQYFFYMPQIHSIDFEHRGIYQIELTYNNHTNTIWFAVLDPEKRWDEP